MSDEDKKLLEQFRSYTDEQQLAVIKYCICSVANAIYRALNNNVD